MKWKDPPPRREQIWINKSIEIQILLACNWSCQACDQHSQFSSIGFVKRATMTTAQINKFIDEMRAADAYIGRVRLVGGEPTLHPKFATIVQLLHARLVILFVAYPYLSDELLDGGDLLRVATVSHHFKAANVPLRKQRTHVANLTATPAELGYEGKMCSAPWHCGFSLNYYGYFPCSSGAGIARMRDWMQHQRLTLPLPNVRAAWPDLQELCNFCYHALRPEDKVRCGTGQEPGQFELNAPSKDAWAQLGPWLAGKQPTWPVYGDAPCPSPT